MIIVLSFCFSFCSTGVWTHLGSIPWATPPVLYFFLWRVFWDRISWTICPGWLQTAILPISASWVARITGVSYRCLAPIFFSTFHSTAVGFQYLKTIQNSCKQKITLNKTSIQSTFIKQLYWGHTMYFCYAYRIPYLKFYLFPINCYHSSTKLYT
jgi:hypothetical protein